MKKFRLVLVMLLLITSSLLAFSSQDLANNAQEPCFPSHKSLGQLSSAEDEASALLTRALTETFDLQWTEKYLDEASRKALCLAWSETLAILLPQEGFVLSRPIKQNEAYVITALLSDGTKLDFVISGRILALRS